MTGLELKEILQNRRVILSELADKIGYTRQNFNSKLQGKDLSLSFVLEVLNAVNISLYDVLGTTNKKNNDNTELLQNENIELLKENRYLRMRIDELEKKYPIAEPKNHILNEPVINQSKLKPNKEK